MSDGMNRRTMLKMCAGSAAMAAGGMSSAQGAAAASAQGKRPNIILLMTDQHRGDCIGADGHPVIHTPNLDRLAQEGAIFTSGYSCTPTCTPARAALLSGLNPWNNGMLGYSRVADKYPVEMPQALRDGGYYTLGIGKMHWHPQRHRHGFHEVILDESGRSQAPEFISDYRAWFKANAPGKQYDATGIGWNDYRSRAYVHDETLHPTYWTAQVAVNFIEQYDAEDPYYLKVSFARPHSPYDPPKRWMDYYKNKDLPEAAIGDWADRYKEPSSDTYTIWHGDKGKEQVRKSREGYYGSISFIDEQIGRIIKSLEEKGELDNTLIVMTADHGDMQGDHHMWRKSYAYEPSARVPMIMRWPESVDAPRGQRIAAPVELRDILPTFLDAAQVTVDSPLDGDSMLKLAKGKGKAKGWREYIDLEHDVCYSKANHWTALTDGKVKYIFHAFDGEEQLFDLTKDPLECKDLAKTSSHAKMLKKWRQRMVEHLEERGEDWVKDGKLVLHKGSILLSPNYPGAAKV